MPDIHELLAEYDQWRSDRADLSAAEEVNLSGGPGVKPNDWEQSDDAGCDLAQRLADALRAHVDETVYRWTRVDVEDAAGRPVTDDELYLVGEAIGYSSIPEAFGEVVFAATLTHNRTQEEA